MLLPGFAFDLRHGTDIHAGMDGKIDDQFGQVDVTIATEFGWVFSKYRHETHRPFEKGFWENVIVEGTRFKRRPSLGVERGDVRFFKGERCRLLNVDMVRMFVSADWVEGQDDIRFEFSDIFDNTSRHFIDGM